MLITGIQAAGKSTVAQLLAERLPKSVHVRGDLFRRMVVNGRVDVTPPPSEEAMRQLRLRYRLMASTCDAYAQAGFDVVAQDVIIGDVLSEVVDMFATPPHVI
ncbi:AAA family ATPase, partial [Kibdelosporangium lantanae]